MTDLISGNSLERKHLVYHRLSGQGLVSPKIPSAVLEVWILGSSVLPQPGNKVGVWDDTANWIDTNVWYD